jgi:hypothetical protein
MPWKKEEEVAKCWRGESVVGEDNEGIWRIVRRQMDEEGFFLGNGWLLDRGRGK